MTSANKSPAESAPLALSRFQPCADRIETLSPANNTLIHSRTRDQPTADDGGLPLEDLSAAYAELLQRGNDPYEAVAESSAEPVVIDVDDNPLAADIGCDLTPRSILESMLFVGNTQNQPHTARQIAALMRGVRPQEIDELVRELNEQYTAENCPYFVASIDAGYTLQLRDDCAPLRDQFYGRIKDAKLTQTAIDVLAIVAYKQPLTREDVDRFRGRPSGSVLSQLVRRELLRIDRAVANKQKVIHYRTTDRFLQIFGLDSLAELPDSEEG